MRIALISDLHGNVIALEAALAEIRRVGVDRIVCLGDVATLGPRPSEVLAMLRELECPCVMGNHDEFLLEPELVHRYTEAPPVVQAIDWCREQLSEDDLAFVSGFTRTLEIPLDGSLRLFAFHGSPGSHMEDILATTPPDELERMLAGHVADVMAGGHTHIQMLRQHRGTLVVNPGSVGMPFAEPTGGAAPTILAHTELAIVEGRGGAVQIAFHRVPLDRAALRAEAQGSSNPLGPMLAAQYA